MDSVEDLYRSYAPEIFRLFLRLGHDPPSAEDLMQETFLKAMLGLPSLRRPSSVRAWLTGIALNVHRRTKRTRAREARAVVAVMRLEDAPTSPAAETEAMTTIGWETLRDHLDRLSERDAHLLILRHVEGREYRDIAEALGLQEPAVRMAASRARDRLRETLEGSKQGGVPQ